MWAFPTSLQSLALSGRSGRRVRRGWCRSQRALSAASLWSGVVSETTRFEAVKAGRVLLSKVPEVTVWFWVIKILCTTV
ncbi:MAG: hypothetical protein QOG75_1754, partial [Mycobacterium sp.]|nr:hypothetical protein [Mycobacterium sp.]